MIKKIRSWSNMPIIVISARTEDKDKIEALDAGADDYLTKPFSVDELLARLRAITRRLPVLMNQTVAENSAFVKRRAAHRLCGRLRLSGRSRAAPDSH